MIAVLLYLDAKNSIGQQGRGHEVHSARADAPERRPCVSIIALQIRLWYLMNVGCLSIFEAGERGLIDAYIIAPPTIYGKGHGPVRHRTQSSA